jgi:hypothetical protein
VRRVGDARVEIIDRVGKRAKVQRAKAVSQAQPNRRCQGNLTPTHASTRLPRLPPLQGNGPHMGSFRLHGLPWGPQVGSQGGGQGAVLPAAIRRSYWAGPPSDHRYRVRTRPSLTLSGNFRWGASGPCPPPQWGQGVVGVHGCQASRS